MDDDLNDESVLNENSNLPNDRDPAYKRLVFEPARDSVNFPPDIKVSPYNTVELPMDTNRYVTSESFMNHILSYADGTFTLENVTSGSKISFSSKESVLAFLVTLSFDPLEVANMVDSLEINEGTFYIREETSKKVESEKDEESMESKLDRFSIDGFNRTTYRKLRSNEPYLDDLNFKVKKEFPDYGEQHRDDEDLRSLIHSYYGRYKYVAWAVIKEDENFLLRIYARGPMTDVELTKDRPTSKPDSNLRQYNLFSDEEME